MNPAGYLRCSYKAATPTILHRYCLRGRRMMVTGCTGGKKKEKVIVISGPTGAGKSRLALELSKRLNGEIVSADSVQVYRGLDIGSAKPSPSQRKEVPHHLVDILHPSEEYSVGRFFEDARLATREIIDRGRVPIVTGGTGLYLRWFIYGKPDVPKASKEISSEVYSVLEELQKNCDWDAGVELVVKAGDPKAQYLPANDWYRLRRSLEIIKSSGSPPSAFQVPYASFRGQSTSHVEDFTHDMDSSVDGHEDIKSMNLEYDFMCFFLSSHRTDLYKLIDFRCEDMLTGSDSIFSEASNLLDIGLLPNSNSATRAIGYRQIWIVVKQLRKGMVKIINTWYQAMEYLMKCREDGGLSSSRDFFVFLSDFQKASRNFAKRQLTWFRNEHIYQWIDASRPLEQVLDFIHEAYHDQSKTLTVPESLWMKKNASNRREVAELKAYRTENRHFISRDDCSIVLDWIRRTQGQPAKVICR